MRHRYRITNDPNQITLPFDGKDPFDRWAKGFFRARRLNTFIPYKQAFCRYREKVDPKITSLGFKKALSLWCQRMNYVLDPPKYWNSDKRIIRQHEFEAGLYKATEMIFIQTSHETN